MIENQPASDADTDPGAAVIAADDTGLLRGEQLIAQAEIDEQLEPNDQLVPDPQLESLES